jgi:hypothetical protein
VTSEIVRWSVIHLSLVGRFNFNHATIAEVKMVAESNVGRDLNESSSDDVHGPPHSHRCEE